MIRPELLRESLAVQEWLDEGRVEGRVEGRAEGRAEGATSEARALLLKFLAFRFPGWPVPASLHSISNVDVLNRLFDKAAIAKDSASMARTIDRASKGLNF